MRALLMKTLALVVLTLCVAAMPAQGLPMPVAPIHVTYPPIGRAAHVSGDAVVRFSIADDGSVQDVRAVSGPEMLVQSLVSQAKIWRFRTPLPIGSSRNWTARFSFRLDSGEDQLEDTVDGPPWYPCCGDLITTAPSAVQVTGSIVSDGGQSIDVTPTPPLEPCPTDGPRQPPAHVGLDDYVELDRRQFYRMRVYRSGRVEWHGDERAGLAATGDRQFSIPSGKADGLMGKFAEAAFWGRCGVPLPPDQEKDGEPVYGHFLTVHLGSQSKTVRVLDDVSEKYAWAVDTVANSHAWRHGEAVGESFRNMDGDLHEPKSGVTALMRAVDHYNPSKAQWTDAALKFQLARRPDLETADESGWTALMYAAGLHGTCCDDSAVKLLVEAGADVNHASLHGESPLMAVAYEGYLSETLLKAGAKINARNADGVTVLMLLAQQLRPDAIAEALEAGADATAKDMQGRTALDYLREASCDRAIVPLPIPYIVIGSDIPAPCPAVSAAYRESEALLKLAMKKKGPKD